MLGDEFIESALAMDAEREGIRLTGLAGLPAFSRGNALAQYFFVNGRPVRDKLLGGALRAAYADVLARDRHPVAALFIDLEPHQVDVNVHPAKADVRFRDAALVRGLVIGSLRQAIASADRHGVARARFRTGRRILGGYALRAARCSDMTGGSRLSPPLQPKRALPRRRRSSRAASPSGNVSQTLAGLTVKPSTRGGAGTAPPQLHRFPDARRSRDRRPACRA